MADLEEVLDPLRVVAVALTTDPLHLLDLACLAGSLDILEVNLWVLAKVHDRSQEVEQTCVAKNTFCWFIKCEPLARQDLIFSICLFQIY